MSSNDSFDFADATIQDVANTMFKRISGVSERERKTRLLTTILSCSVLLDITLTVILGFVVAGFHSQQVRLQHQQATITEVQQAHEQDVINLHNSQLNACAVGNHFRRGQLAVWEEFLHLATANPVPKPTPAQQRHTQQVIAEFQAFLHAQYKEVDCAKLYPKP